MARMSFRAPAIVRMCYSTLARCVRGGLHLRIWVPALIYNIAGNSTMCHIDNTKSSVNTRQLHHDWHGSQS
jgi:hypothetical protein